MAKEHDVKVRIGADGKQARAELDKTKKATGQFSKSASSSLKSFAKTAVSIGAVYLALKKLSQFMKTTLEAYGSQETAVLDLNSAMRQAGTYSQEASQRILLLASNLQQVTIYGDEATLAAAALAQSLGKLSEDELAKVIPMIQDMAAGMKIDLKTAATLFGKTLGSTTNALSRYGIIIDATADKQTKMAELQAQINEKFGGRAQDLARTYTGQVIQLKNSYGDLKEEIGFLVSTQMPGFVDLGKATVAVLIDMVEWIGRNKKEIEEYRRALHNMNVEQLEEQIRLNDIRIDQMAETMRALDQVMKSHRKLSREYRNAKKELEPLNEEWWKLIKRNKELNDQVELLTKRQFEAGETINDTIPKILMRKKKQLH